MDNPDNRRRCSQETGDAHGSAGINTSNNGSHGDGQMDKQVVGTEKVIRIQT